ncbi:MAG: 30S ribosomal protein S17 [Bacteroidetes bacterium]|nr:30S ribosomal protein S17 [Bacteroidota bacterium]NCQ11464.1 30S ribosomal protein S17 [Bacteroidota bacterium]
MSDTLERGLRKTRTGRVVSNKMDKSITVSVNRQVKHPIYGKFITKTKKYMAHDENNDANVGDLVTISETRPISKLKKWRLLEIVERAK